MDVLVNYVNGKFLVPIFCFQYSVYSVRHGITKNGVLFMSYRDPRLLSTYEVYAQLPEMIRAVEITQEELNDYIISTYSPVAAPYSPLTGGGTAVLDALRSTDTFAEALAQIKDITCLLYAAIRCMVSV